LIIGRNKYLQFSPFPSHTTIFFYLLKECLLPIFLAFIILTVLVFSQQIARNLEFLISPFSTWQVSSGILTNLLPGVVIFTLPISLLVGMTIALSKLSSESEWVAMEALALRRGPRLLPFALLGTLGTLLLLQLTWNVAPRSVAQVRSLRELVTIDQAALQIRPRSFITNIPNHLLQIKSLDRQTGMWKGVLLIKQDPKTKNMQVVAAQRGFISREVSNNESSDSIGEIKLQDGVSIDKMLTPQAHESIAFKEYVYKLALNQKRSNTTDNPLSSGEITATSTSKLLRQSKSKLPQAEARQISIEIQRRFALSFACIFAVIVVCALNFQPGQRTTKNLTRLVIGFLFCVLYYSLLGVGQSWAVADKISVMTGLWLPSIASLLVLLLYIQLRPTLLIFWQKLQFQPKKPVFEPALVTANNEITAKPMNSKAKSKRTSLFINLVNYLLISEVTKYFLIALGILVATVLLFTMLDISPSLTKNNLSGSYAAGYLLLLSPQMIYYFAPFALLLGLIIAAAALARSGQLTVLFYYANSLPQLFLCILILSSLVLGTMYLIAEAVLPITNQEQDERFRRIKGRKDGDITSTIAFERKWIFDENGNVAGFKVLNPGTSSVQYDVLQFRLREEYQYFQEALFFPQAAADRTKLLTGTPAFRYQTDEIGLARLDSTPNLAAISLNLTSDELFRTPAFEASKMSFSQLKRYIRDVERVGLPITSLKMDKASRTTFPFACFSLACLALPLAFVQIKRSQKGSFQIVGAGIVLALLFWATMSLFETAGKNGLIPIDLAAWAPHGLYISLAAVLHAKLNAS
jgi:lipopolysaccharide export LptBFGC system permease protein LptF